jgi:hypothetical protein
MSDLRAALERIIEEPKNTLSDGKALKAIIRIAKDAIATHADAAAEPVAVVGADFTILWAGAGPIAPLIERHGIKVGSKLYAAPAAALTSAPAEPIDMVLHCPKCGLQHVDASDATECAWPQCSCADQVDRGCIAQDVSWTNPPHRSHLCHGCGHIWRPADVPTNGVQAVKTTGKADSPIAPAEPPQAAGAIDAREQGAEEDAYVIDRLGKLLAGVAIALKGEELPLHRHGYHDLPDLARVLKLELDLYRATFPNGVPESAFASREEAPPAAGAAQAVDKEQVAAFKAAFHLAHNQIATCGDYDACVTAGLRAALAATPAPEAVAERFCNKCGYFGPDQLHQRPNGSGECGYLSMPTSAALKAAHPGERKDEE